MNICIYCIIVQEELDKVVDMLNICIYCIIVQEELKKDAEYLYLLYCLGGAGEGCE